MNLFRRTYTGRIKKKGSHEIDPEDVFLDSENLSELDVHQLEGHLERPLDKKMFYATVILSSVLALSGLQADERRAQIDSLSPKIHLLDQFHGTLSF
jgi:hypothetical protein